MRVSEAALALITRVTPQGEAEYLTQWNEKWQAYSLIGGHREPDESFRDCCGCASRFRVESVCNRRPVDRMSD